MADQLDRLQSALEGLYHVERLLGEGGMAYVYLATDLRQNRQVAIKVLKPDLSATIGAERFLREIRVAAALQHPNILGLYDSGTTDGLFYYVMPFIKGESLRDRLDRDKQLPIEEGLRIVREAAAALQFAHDNGIIHRDIKPENILLNDGHALVADFGIAKAIEDASGEKLTKTGMAIGTPHYMSPEQSLGEQVDGRSDQYSLGCVLFEILVGQPPFTGPTAMSILARHSLEQVPSMQVVRGSIPDAVEDAAFRALEKSKVDRYPSMTAFAEALSESEMEASLQRTQARRVAGVPRMTTQSAPVDRRTLTRGLRTPADAPPAPNPRRRWLMLGAALLVIGGAALAIRASMQGPPRPSVMGDAAARRVAVLYFTSDADSLRALADGLTEGVIGELAQVQDLQVISRNGVAQFRGTDLTADSIARALQVGTLVKGDIRQDGALVRGTVSLVDAAGGATIGDPLTFLQPTSDYLALRDTLAANVASLIRKNLGIAFQLKQQRASTRSSDAWLLLQRAEQARKRAETAIVAGDTLAVQREFASADSLAQLASERDGSWNAPLVFRGTIRYRQSRLAINNPTAAGRYIDEGLAFAKTATARDNTDADAFELSGSLRYWRWLLQLDVDATAATLLADAENELELSTRLNPTQAGAWSQLSHLYYQTSNLNDVMLAAQRAYEADAYLESAPSVLNRLFLASFDSDQEAKAASWCAEGRRRLPNDARFAMCQLYLMTMRAQNPDVAAAWAIAASPVVRNDVVTGSPEFREREARMLVAAVLAKAGLRDSAIRTARAAIAPSAIDPTKSLYDLQAFALLLAGDRRGAIESIKVYVGANPSRRNDFRPTALSWRFAELAGDSALKRIAGSS